MKIPDQQTLHLFIGVGLLLVVASIIGWVLRARVNTAEGKASVANLNSRIWAWWVMVIIFAIAVVIGPIGTVVLFTFVSFFALREFITLVPSRRGDHRALFWVFFIITPLNYYLLASRWYGLFIILVPVYAFLFIPMRMVLTGDFTEFFQRAAKTQWALMICVYCISHAPALLFLPIKGYEGQNSKLMFFLVAIVQLSDVMQYVFGKILGRHKIAPTVSPNKTWEGLIGGILSVTLIGAALWKITPFTPIQAAAMALLIGLMGFAGGLIMSAIKRDHNIKDYGTLIEGHGGMMDRMDSLSFAAPVFFHLTRWLLT